MSDILPDSPRGVLSCARRPLLVAADPGLLDDLQRLAAAADVTVDIARDGGEARRFWPYAPAVLVDVDVAEELREVVGQRRGNVVVVARDEDRPDLFRIAVGIGAQDVAILPDAENRLAALLAEAAEPALDDALTICVAGGRGGAGASVVAAGLAMTGARRGERVLLTDADPLGGGLDLVLGVEDCPGARWPDFLDRHGRLSATALRAALPRVDDLAVLAWQRGAAKTIPPQAIRAVGWPRSDRESRPSPCGGGRLFACSATRVRRTHTATPHEPDRPAGTGTGGGRAAGMWRRRPGGRRRRRPCAPTRPAAPRHRDVPR